MTDENGTAVDDVTTSKDVIIEDEVTEVNDELKVAEDDEIIVDEAMVIVSGIDELVTVEEDMRFVDDIGDEMVQELLLVYVNARNNKNVVITLYLNSTLPEFEGAVQVNVMLILSSLFL